MGLSSRLWTNSNRRGGGAADDPDEDEAEDPESSRPSFIPVSDATACSRTLIVRFTSSAGGTAASGQLVDGDAAVFLPGASGRHCCRIGGIAFQCAENLLPASD